jgi:RNA-directed DNA polymerase
MKTNNSKEKVLQLQNKLYLAAKKCSTRRFHALYDKVYRKDVLLEAWKRVKANQGSSGIDGISIEDIEFYGIENYLAEIQKELMLGNYSPKPVKRVMIPKPDGSKRPLGIPTVKDRIVQMATKIAIEPVFEADFKDCSYGFRPKRSAKQALEVARKACNNKGYYVVDADIEKFFDRVNQDKLMKLVEQRVSDRRILKLIRQWLKAGVLYGNILEVSELGTSQGSVISPLLANIYLNMFDRLWEKYGLTHGKLIRYADDSAPRRRVQVA